MFERAGKTADTESPTTRRWASPIAFPDRQQAARGSHLAIEHVPHAVLIVSEAGDIVTSNRAADALFMRAPGHLAGHRVDDLLPDLTLAVGGEPWSRVCERPQTLALGIDEPLAGVRADGSVIPVEVELKTLPDGPAPQACVSVRDVTDRVLHAAQEQAAAAAQLRLQRLIGDLAARLVTSGSEQIDDTVADGLRRVAEAMQLDQAVLWQKPIAGTTPPPYEWSRGAQAPGAALEMSSLLLIAAKLEAGETACFTRLEDIPGVGETLRRQGMRSVAVFPVEVSGGDVLARGALAFSSRAIDHEWDPAIIEPLRIVAGVMGQALARKAALAGLRHTTEGPRASRDARPVDDPATSTRGGPTRVSSLIVCEGPGLRPALAQVDQVAPTPATVLLLGETGAGKDVFAQAIHELSPRRHRPMVRVSCAAIPAALIESELFGRERGAFTGALTRQIGRFEAAHQSTIFLDEIGELPAEVQVKLLRVLQERVIERLGSVQTIKVDVRIVAATNRNLEQAVRDKAFREDLFYRLNVFPIVVPPLRDRVDDIPALAWEFVEEFSKSFAKPIESIAKDSMRQLQQYQWPGNVRELRNVIERAMILATGPCLTVPLPQPAITHQIPSHQTLRSLEIEHIRATLDSTNWRVRGHGGAAERLGLKPTTLEGRMAKLGLARPRRA
jgi:PAS domain S-box-containing protein